MQKFRWFIIVFLGIGVLLLLGAALLWNNTRSFLARARETSGEVIELREVRDNDGGSSTWKPVVRFTAGNGRNITFASLFSSNPAPYDVGERVSVLYLPGEPAPRLLPEVLTPNLVLDEISRLPAARPATAITQR